MRKIVDFGNGMIITQQQAEYQSDGHSLNTPGLKSSDKNERGYHTPPETTQNRSPYVWFSGNTTAPGKGFRAVI